VSVENISVSKPHFFYKQLTKQRMEQNEPKIIKVRDLLKLATGIYILQINTKGPQNFYSKFIKQ
jgi:hypothetical protein